LSSWESITARLLSHLRIDRVRNKILAFTVLATLVPSFATGWLAYTQGRQALTEKISGELVGVSSQAAHEVDLWLKERLYDLRVFSNSYEVTENLQRALRAGSGAVEARYAKARLGDYLNSVQERFVDYRQLVVFDAKGRPVAGSPVRAVPLSLPRDWEADVRSGNPVLGKPYWDRPGKRLVVVAAVPIQPPGGQLIGTLAIQLDLAEAHSILRRTAAGHSGQALLINSDGTLITSSESTAPVRPTRVLSAEAARTLTADAERVVGYSNHEGTEVLGTSRQVSRANWRVVAELPRDEGYGQIIRLRNVTFGVLAAIFSFVGLLAYLLGLMLVRPLERLEAGAKQVAEGNFDVMVPVVTGGELGFLTQAFNRMVERIREGRQRLDETNEELRQTNAQLERLSQTDPLTGLYNRRHLMATLEAEVRRAGRSVRTFSILMIDVDHFKTYNDAFGHQAGDEALRRVAVVLRATLRDVDFAARYGGEEFLILLPDTAIAQAVEVAGRIRARLAEERVPGGTVTLSIGAAEFPLHGASLESLIAGADAALYHAKRLGRDRVVRADWAHHLEPEPVRA
jgi:diguanylate cyclase (GGDEF)-like protein